MSKPFKTNHANSDRSRNSRGSDVPIDTFLYACLEAEQTAQQRRPIQWPTLQDLSPKDLKDELDALALRDVFEDLMSWYSANYPDLATSEPWDYGAVSIVVQPLVCMAADLNFVHEQKNGEPLPIFVQDVEMNHSSTWALIKSLVERFFGTKSHYILRYFSWSFGPNKDLSSSESDDESRPPVGRFSPSAQRSRQNNRHAQQPRRSSGGDRDFNSRDYRSDDRGNAAPRGNNRYPDRERPRRNYETNAEAEAAAIQACREAMDFLETNPNEEKFELKPQNSFYRRIQHQVIVSNGFHSESVGEGNERAVVVWRATQR